MSDIKLTADYPIRILITDEKHMVKHAIVILKGWNIYMVWDDI